MYSFDNSTGSNLPSKENEVLSVPGNNFAQSKLASQFLFQRISGVVFSVLGIF